MELGSSLATSVNGAVEEINWQAVGRYMFAGIKIALEMAAGFVLTATIPATTMAGNPLSIAGTPSITAAISAPIARRISGELFAIIPPNREFMAVLGDQNRGNNIETPEDLLRKIYREESGGANAEVLSILQALLEAGHPLAGNGELALGGQPLAVHLSSQLGAFGQLAVDVVARPLDAALLQEEESRA